MIDASSLPALRDRGDVAMPVEATPNPTADGEAIHQPPGYPSKKLVLDSGRYVIATSTK